MKVHLKTTAILGILLFLNCAEYVVTIADIDPKLAAIPIVADMEFMGVSYFAIGNPHFDEFYLSVAKLNGLAQFSRTMVGNSTSQLKKYAMSKYSNEALKGSIEEFGDPDSLSTEEAIAIMKLAKKQKQVNGEEKLFIAGTSAALLAASAGLIYGIKEVPNLLKQGGNLLAATGSLTAIEQVGAIGATAKCIDNLHEIRVEVPILLEEMKILKSGFEALKE